MRRILVGLALVVAGCAAPVSTAPILASPAFDLDVVKATLVEDCATDGGLVDVAICAQVRLLGMTADGETLIAPTRLVEGAADDLAAELCAKVASLPEAPAPIDLGFTEVTITDGIGRPLATCSVS